MHCFWAFSTGRFYKYEGVPVKIYDDMLTATSQGKFFHAEIRPNFVGTKLDDAAVAAHSALLTNS